MSEARLRPKRAHNARPAAAPAAAALPQLQFTQIAFAGHNRTEDLGDPAHVSAALDSAFAALAQAGVHEARLISGLAPGADLLAVRAWRAAGLGPVHAVFPFTDDTAEPAAWQAVESATWLDGRATEAVGRNAHLAQTRWLIGAADLLVVVWTGEHARGAGGTADAVRLALEHGIPVLWVKPGEPTALRLIRPEHLDEDFGFLEFLEELQFGQEPLVRPATPAAIHEALADLGLRDKVPDVSEAAPDAEEGRPPTGVWRTYAHFRRIFGGTAPAYAARPVPPDLADEPGFQRLTRALARADAEASQLGAIHRSHQVILLGVAILIAVAGAASSVWPEVKLAMVSVELLLAVGALLVYLDSEKGVRHHRWGEARRLAEDLRHERAAWVLGVSTIPHGANFSSSHAARQVRRRAGLPRGVYDRDRVASWGDWAVDELIAGQAAYHRSLALISGRIGHRVHQVESNSATLLLVLLVAYVLAAVAMQVFGLEAPHWLGSMVTVAGAIVPAIAAASLAIEATLSLNEQAQRSRLLAARLEALAADLGPRPGLEALQAQAKAAIRLQRAQEDHWTEGTVRRRLFRGG